MPKHTKPKKCESDEKPTAPTQYRCKNCGQFWIAKNEVPDCKIIEMNTVFLNKPTKKERYNICEPDAIGDCMCGNDHESSPTPSQEEKCICQKELLGRGCICQGLCACHSTKNSPIPESLNAKEDWKERLMDEFCVMFERATKNDDTIDWVTQLEKFISSELHAAEQRGAQRERERIYTYLEEYLMGREDSVDLEEVSRIIFNKK